jgi:hypothetical protein
LPQQLVLCSGGGVREGPKVEDVGGPTNSELAAGPWGRMPARGCWSGSRAAPKEASAGCREATAARRPAPRVPGTAARPAAAPTGRAMMAPVP